MKKEKKRIPACCWLFSSITHAALQDTPHHRAGNEYSGEWPAPFVTPHTPPDILHVTPPPSGTLNIPYVTTHFHWQPPTPVLTIPRHLHP
ncbi:hypothetical protein Pcinc_034475 [Petrolisthes cinctipes]|uniref:Uncharacterized protein n=1 Tax=Petrolisthes cinctipes TaxID=88211 RepID=A0AAE1EQ62_PETCI|nr:hypothetical protein Pcinc_034475 [Petrolisthes cinctipes]